MNLEPYKIYIKLWKDGDEFKRIHMLVHPSQNITQVKRKIEEEYLELFPGEIPFLVGRMEDEQGYTLSNWALVADIIKSGSTVTALEQGTHESLQGTDPIELANLMTNICASVTCKITEIKINQDQVVLVWLDIIPLGFSNNIKILHNICKILQQTVSNKTSMLLEDHQNIYVLNKFVLMLQYWIFEMIEIDQMVFKTLIHCLEILVHLPMFAQQFRTPIIMTKLMQLPRNPSVPPEAKMALVKIIRILAATEQKHGGDYTMPVGSQAFNFVTQGMNYGKEMMNDYQNTRIKQLQEKAMMQNQQQSQFSTIYKPPPGHNSNPNQYQNQQYEQQNFKNNQLNDQQFLQHQMQYQNPNNYEQSNRNNNLPPQRLQQSRNLSRKGLEQKDLRQSYQNEFIKVQNNSSFDNNIQDKYRTNQNEDSSRRSRRGIQSGYRQNQQPLNQNPQQANDMFKNMNNPDNQVKNYQTFDLSSMNLMKSEQESLVRDYVNMLDPPAYNEMFNFALASLIPALKVAWHVIMEEKDLFMKCFNLIDFKCDSNVLKYQAELFQVMAQNMNDKRASDAVRANGVQRLIQAHASQHPEIQRVIGQLFESMIKHGKVSLDANSLILLAVCKQLELAELGMKALNSLSDPSSGDFNELQFENHLALILNSTTNHLSKSYRISALNVISNLCLRDKLKAPLMYAGAIQVLTGSLRSGEMEIERLAAKGLANLCSSRKDIRHKVISELGMEIKRLHNKDLDGVVAAYIQTMIHP